MQNEEQFPEDRSLSYILAQLKKLTNKQDIPQRIDLLRKALKIVSFKQNPQLWAELKLKLGNSFLERSQGEQVGNVQQIIYDLLFPISPENNQELWTELQPIESDAAREKIQDFQLNNFTRFIKLFLAAISPENNPALWKDISICAGDTLLYGTHEESFCNLKFTIWEILNIIDPEYNPALWKNLTSWMNDDSEQENQNKQLNCIKRVVQEILDIVVPEYNPQLWAELQTWLESGLYEIGAEGQLESLKKVIKKIFDILVPEHNPQLWAELKAWTDGIVQKEHQKERQENFRSTIRKILTFVSPQNNPTLWTELQTWINNKKLNKNQYNRSEDIESAIQIYNQIIETALQGIPIPEETFKNAINRYRVADYERLLGPNFEQILGISKEILEDPEKLQEAIKPNIDTETEEGKAIELILQENRKPPQDRRHTELIRLIDKALPLFPRDQAPEPWNFLLQIALSSSLVEVDFGNINENLERAISICQDVLKDLSYENMSPEWLIVMNCLSAAYWKRLQGNRFDNQEFAIENLKQALETASLETTPLEWARTLNNLGTFYIERIQGDKEDNIDQAIDCYKQILDAISAWEVWQLEWEILNNLATAYRKRIRGDLVENQELAIDYYREAVDVARQNNHPLKLAQTFNNLSGIFIERISGDLAENIEQAIEYGQESLARKEGEERDFERANTRINLGLAYYQRIHGNRKENLEKAIEVFKQALEEWTCEYKLGEWAATKNNLAIVYTDLAILYTDWLGASVIFKGNKTLTISLLWVIIYREENLKSATDNCQDVLDQIKREDFPIQWAQAKTNLANALLYREDNREENLKQTITAYEEALEVATKESMPVEWSKIMTSLALAYIKSEKNNSGETLGKAINIYQNVLQFAKARKLPYECLRAGQELGNVASMDKKWDVSIEGYKTAIEAVEQTRGWTILEHRRQEIIAESIAVYQGIIQSYISLGQLDKALEYAERSKAQTLVELLATRNLTPKGDIPQETLEKLVQLKRRIANKQKLLSIDENRRKLSISSENVRLQPQLSDYAEINQLQQELDELVDQIKSIDSTFNLTQKVNPIAYEEMRNIIDDQTAIIEWYITDNQVIVFLITHQHQNPQVWRSSIEDLTDLVNWVNEYLQNYYTNQQEWKNNLETNLLKLSGILHLDEILSLLPKKCNRLILIPHRFLHILPLHALPVFSQIEKGAEDQYLLDLFPKGVQYVPSCQLLLKLTQNQQLHEIQDLFAIQNPTGDLIYTELEVETIRSFFNDAEVLSKQTDIKASLKLHPKLPLANCVHFSCHGIFNSVSPLESTLILSKDKADTEDSYLTLAEIFELYLSQCRLVTLSACETGFTDFNSLSDEYIGLPSGFLFAGSLNVVSSLWTVDDFSTAFLMIKFYENLRTEHESQEKNVAVALKNAQNWLRNLTPETGEEFLKQIEPYIEALYRGKPRTIKSFKSAAFKRIKEFGSHPFSNPFDWAAFTATGF